MHGTRVSRRALLAQLFLGARPLLVRWAGKEEHLHPVPDLSRFPERLADRQKLSDDSLESGVQSQLRADQFLNRNFLHSERKFVGNVFIAWFQSQRRGANQPHSPQVCLPGNGWTAPPSLIV